MENTRKTKGITIISLVVTIVVLLILASVTVNVLFGDNGVVKNVSARQYTAYEKIAKEEVKKLTMEYDIANSGETLEEFLIDKVQEGRIEEVTRKDDKTLIVRKNGYEIEVESENRIFIIEAEAYVGTYDGKSHDVLTSVSVSPSDAKIEYSTDNGNTYNEEMPTVINATSVPFIVKVSKTGYKTETITRTAIVNKAEGKVTLSATSGTITYPDSTTFTASGNTGTLSVSSNSTSIATASLSGSTITVKSGTKAGKATITVTSAESANYNEKSATYTATVQNGTITLSATPYTGTYDGKAHNAITSVTVNPTDATIEYSTDGTNYSTTMPTVTNSSSFTVTVRASKAGYKTQTTTQTVKVNKATGTLTLSATSGTLTYPTNATFTASGNKGTLSVASSNTNIATASISGNTVTVKPGTTAGKATITVTSAASTNYNAKSATYTATVNNGTISLSATPYTGTYDGKAHNAITKVTANPSDAKIEYSTNGTTYSTTMPTITNTSSFTVTVRASKAGYKTQSTTQTVKVNKADGKLTLSATSGTYTYPTSGTFTVSGNTGTLSVASNNTNIATVSVSGNTVTVKPGTTAGKATITVTSAEASNYNAKSATYTATVNNGTISLSATPYTGTYDGKAHNAITSVTVNPSDAKIDYSTDGTNYSTTMPTITNTSSFTVTVRASKAGYKTQSTTQTVKVNNAAGTLTLSATSGTLTYPTNATFTVSGNKGTLSVASSNTNIATASISGSTVTVKPGTTAGKATITVTSAATTNYNPKSATYTATVNNGTISLSATPYTGTYDGKAHNAITKVTVTPSDAKIEYSTDGKTYSTTMPKITNTSSFTVTVRASKAGYKTQSATQTVKVNKAAGKLTLSATSGTINYPNSTTFIVSGNTGTLSVSSSNTSVATVSISGNTVTIKSVGAGSATITVKSAASTNYNEKTATYSVTVKDNTFKENSGVGYYADTDGDGTPDGVIFEDFKNGGRDSWGSVSYIVPTVTGLKEYYISQTNYKGPFGTKDVLTATGSGNARFYVMALSDYNNSATYTFNYAKGITSGEWRVSTKELWAAFAEKLRISNSYYSSYGLKAKYWTSSAYRYANNHGYCVNLSDAEIEYDGNSDNKYPVRLARTF